MASEPELTVWARVRRTISGWEIQAEKDAERIAALEAACVRKNEDGAAAYQCIAERDERIAALEELVKQYADGARVAEESHRKRIAALEAELKDYKLHYVHEHEVMRCNEKIAELEAKLKDA